MLLSPKSTSSNISTDDLHTMPLSPKSTSSKISTDDLGSMSAPARPFLEPLAQVPTINDAHKVPRCSESRSRPGSCGGARRPGSRAKAITAGVLIPLSKKPVVPMMTVSKSAPDLWRTKIQVETTMLQSENERLKSIRLKKLRESGDA